MFVIRVSSAFFIVVLLTKVSLFVADDSKFIEIEALGAIEKRVGKLIDEAMRHREEEEEREDGAETIAFAVRFVAARKAIVRCVDGVCAWVRSGVHAVRLAATGITVPTLPTAAAVNPLSQIHEKPGLGLPINPTGDRARM